MRFLILAIFLLAIITGCQSTYQQKPDPQFQPARSDVEMKVYDAAFDFSNIKKIYYYTETDNSDTENMTIRFLKEMLAKKGCAVETDYEKTELVIKASRKLMTVMHTVHIMKAGGQKGNEPMIVEINADSPEKSAEEAVKFMFKE